MAEIEEQLVIIAHLSELVHNTFLALREAEAAHLEQIETHYDAKEVLARAIDRMYDEGKVEGKNEREREAHLRRLLPDEHNNEKLEYALMRGKERKYRALLRDTERLTLQVQLARMVSDLRIAQVNNP